MDWTSLLTLVLSGNPLLCVYMVNWCCKIGFFLDEKYCCHRCRLRENFPLVFFLYGKSKIILWDLVICVPGRKSKSLIQWVDWYVWRIKGKVESRLSSGQHKHFLVLNEFPGCSHSDTNLVELEKETIKEDDRAVLLEGGLSRSASARLHSSSIKTNLIRSLPVICKMVMDLHVILVLKSLSYLHLFFFQVYDYGWCFLARKSCNSESNVRHYFVEGNRLLVTPFAIRI